MTEIEIQEPEFHEVCGHFHQESQGCPEPHEPCGSYLCCIN